MLSGSQVATIRKQRGWSQQYLALQSGVNKAYISEYESGVRPSLPPEMLDHLANLLDSLPAGRTSPTIQQREGRSRLVLRDAEGNEIIPDIASVHWTEVDGTSYTMYLGRPDPD